jgi:predicted SprT family Zn-dependent metalloprotease
MRRLFALIAVLTLLCPSAFGRCEGLHAWYSEYNKEYFSDRLPHNVVIDYSQGGEYMATTVRMEDGRFHIAFNEKYTAAERVAHMILLHEMCHVKTWDALDQSHDGHGREWRACMLVLDSEGAFRAQLIDGYNGD